MDSNWALLALILVFMLFLVAVAAPKVFANSPQGNVGANVAVICPFYINLTAQNMYALVANLSFNYSIKALAGCTIPEINGSVTVWNVNTSQSNYIYRKPVTANNLSGIEQIFNVSVSGSLFAPGNYYINVTFPALYYKESANSTSLLEFSAKKPANVSVAITAIGSPVTLYSPVSITQTITNNGELASSSNTILHFHISGPNGFTNNTNYTIGSIGPNSNETKTLLLSSITPYTGNYTVNENVTYHTQYTVGNRTYNSVTLTSKTATAKYNVIPQPRSSSTTPPPPAPLPPTVIANVSYISAPLLVSLLTGQNLLGQLEVYNHNSVPVWVNFTDPGSGCTVSTSSKTMYLLPGQSQSVSMLVSAAPDSIAGTYIVPINESITAVGSAPTTFTQYVTCVVQSQNPSGPSLLNTISLQNSSKTVQGTISMYNPTGRGIRNGTISISLPSIVAINKSDISLYGAPGNVTVRNGTYTLTWSLPPSASGQSSSVYYSVRNASDLFAIESTPVTLTVPSTTQTGSVNILYMNIPTVYTNQSAAITLSGLYTGTSQNNVTLSLVGPPAVNVPNGVQRLQLAPNTAFSTTFGVAGPAQSGTYLMTLYVRGQGISENYSFNMIALPYTKPITTSVATTIPPSPSALRPGEYIIPSLAVIGVIIVGVIVAETHKKLSKPKYSRERAQELAHIKKQVQRGEQS